MKTKVYAWIALALAPLAAGCLTNAYEEHYVAQPSELVEHFVRGRPGTVQVRPAITEEGVIAALEEGYVPLGSSAFVGVHCPWVCAVDVAEDEGADLVLIDEVPKGTGKRTSVVFLPSTQLGYSVGGYRGRRHSGAGVSAGISGGIASQTVASDVALYEQTALFLRKGDYAGFYGALLYIPPRLPDEPVDAEAPVTVLAVLKGSPAARDGIRRGQRVLAVNGTRLTTRSTFAPYERNPRAIRSLEVRQ